MPKLIFILLLLPSLSYGGEWDKTEKALYGSFLILESVDYLQTKEILNPNDNIIEKNPLINKKNVTPYFIGCSLLGYVIADRLDHKKRKIFLMLANTLELGMVAHNYKLGIRFKF